MPYLMRYPRVIEPGMVCRDIVTNVDFAQTYFDLAGLQAPACMQGRCFAPLFAGEAPSDSPQSMYYP